MLCYEFLKHVYLFQGDAAHAAEIDGIVFHNRSRLRKSMVVVDGGYVRSFKHSNKKHEPYLTFRMALGNGRARTSSEEVSMLNADLPPAARQIDSNISINNLKGSVRTFDRFPSSSSLLNPEAYDSGSRSTFFRCRFVGVCLRISDTASPIIARCTVSAPMMEGIQIHGRGTNPDIRHNNIAWVCSTYLE